MRNSLCLSLLAIAMCQQLQAGALDDIKTFQENSRTNPQNILRIAANVVDAETVTIGSEVYEFDANATYTAGRNQVDVSGGLTPTVASAALAAAINANQDDPGTATAVTVNLVLYVLDAPGTAATATTETMTGTNNAWAASTLYGGRAVPVNTVPAPIMTSRIANATEDALEYLTFELAFTPASVFVEVRTTAGVKEAFDGAVTISGGRVAIASSGSIDIDATDVVTLLASP